MVILGFIIYVVILMIGGIAGGAIVLLGLALILYVIASIKTSFDEFKNSKQRKEDNSICYRNSDYGKYLNIDIYSKYKVIFDEWLVSYICDNEKTFSQIRNNFIKHLKKTEKKLESNTVFNNVDFDLCILIWLRDLLKKKKITIITDGNGRKYYIVNEEKLTDKEKHLIDKKHKRQKDKIRNILLLIFILSILLVIYNHHKNEKERALIREHIENNTLYEYDGNKHSRLAINVYKKKLLEYQKNNELDKSIDLFYMLKDVYPYFGTYYDNNKLSEEYFDWMRRLIKSKELKDGYYYQDYESLDNSMCYIDDYTSGKLYYNNYAFIYDYEKYGYNAILNYKIYYKDIEVLSFERGINYTEYCDEANQPNKIFELYYNNHTHYIHSRGLVTLNYNYMGSIILSTDDDINYVEIDVGN